MSRIIRSTGMQPIDDLNKKEIKLHNLFQPIHNEEEVGMTDHTPQLTLDEVLQERDYILAQAEKQIAAEKEQLAALREEQLAALEALKEAWQEEKVELQQQAYEEGFAQGYEEGVQKATAEMTQSVAIANATMEQASENAKAYIESQESVVLELGLTAAERIINATLDRDDELFVSIVKRGLKEAREMKEIKVYVSSDYHGVVTKNRDELVEMFPVDVPFMIFVNEDLAGTESYIETNHGRIVVSIDEQLTELRLKLNEILDSKE
ncbi:MAG: FliH/SctL family protein [Solibacillus sp.]